MIPLAAPTRRRVKASKCARWHSSNLDREAKGLRPVREQAFCFFMIRREPNKFQSSNRLFTYLLFLVPLPARHTVDLCSHSAPPYRLHKAYHSKLRRQREAIDIAVVKRHFSPSFPEVEKSYKELF